MNLKNPLSEEFANVLDKACGRMIGLGLEREAMLWLADELACMLSNDSFKTRPLIPHAKELYQIVVAITLHLNGQNTPEAGPMQHPQSLRGVVQATLTAPS